MDKSVGLLRVEEKSIVKRRVGVDQDVKTVQVAMPFSESNSKFLVGTSKGQVVEWDWEDGKMGKVLDALEVRIG